MYRKLFPGLWIAVFAILLIAALLFKDDMNRFISEKMKQQAGVEVILSGEAWVDSLFNYEKNGKDFRYSLLEFKSTGCTICKQMESVLEKVRNSDDKKINVVVLNIMNPNSQNVMKYFGISAVPTQIILDQSGKEIFRNYGFISAEELLAKLD